MYQLAVFRAIQGLGAGGLFTLALAIIGDIVPPRERSKYQGYFIAVFGSSSVIGPIVGGFLAGQDSILGLTGWRWVFFVNVPIGLVALFVVGRTLHIPNFQRVNHAIDWWGALSLSAGLVPLLIVAQEGRTWGWTSSKAIICYVIGVVSLLLFVWNFGAFVFLVLLYFFAVLLWRTIFVLYRFAFFIFGLRLLVVSCSCVL